MRCFLVEILNGRSVAQKPTDHNHTFTRSRRVWGIFGIARWRLQKSSWCRRAWLAL